MTLVVEDGTGVENANSYASLAQVRAHASARILTVPSDDAELEALVIKAMDYLEGKKLGLLSLSWPLNDGYLCGQIPSTEVLSRLKYAVSQLCAEQASGIELSPARISAFIIEDTIGPITTKYSEKLGGGAGSSPYMPNVENMIAPLIAVCGGANLLNTVRA